MECGAQLPGAKGDASLHRNGGLMTDATPKNTSASIRARLLQQARATHQDFQALAVRYVVERFLARLCASPYGSEFVLKGAMLYLGVEVG